MLSLNETETTTTATAEMDNAVDELMKDIAEVEGENEETVQNAVVEIIEEELTENEEDEETPAQTENAMQEDEETEQPAETVAEAATETAKSDSKEPESEYPTYQPQIYIGGISYGTTEADLKTYFSKFGEISKLTLSKTKKAPDGSQKHRGFAFVAYKDKDLVQTVIAQKHTLGGRDLRVNEAKPKTVKLFVGGINKSKTTKETLTQHFKKFGVVEDCFCIVSRGFGFVTLIEDGDNVKNLLEKGKMEIDGSMCDIKTAKPKQEMDNMGGNRRGGQGQGGRRNNNKFGRSGEYGGQQQFGGWNSFGMGRQQGGYGGFGGYGNNAYGAYGNNAYGNNGGGAQTWSQAKSYQPYGAAQKAGGARGGFNQYSRY